MGTQWMVAVVTVFLLTSVIKNLYSNVQIIFKETITQENTRISHPMLTSATHFSKAEVDIYLHSSKIFNRLEMPAGVY